jgi:hypothetical protein
MVSFLPTNAHAPKAIPSTSRHHPSYPFHIPRIPRQTQDEPALLDIYICVDISIPRKLHARAPNEYEAVARPPKPKVPKQTRRTKELLAPNIRPAIVLLLLLLLSLLK